jgi:hypothetical protein
LGIENLLKLHKPSIAGRHWPELRPTSNSGRSHAQIAPPQPG